MDRVRCQDRPLNLRLNYFSSPSPLVKARRYTVSPGLSGEIESHNRKAQRISPDCDCACAGQK